MRETIGIAIITCDRPEFFKRCRESINNEWYDHIVVVNDGKGPLFDPASPVIQTSGREGVGKAKNKAFQYLIDKGCEHIFLVEDDVVLASEMIDRLQRIRNQFEANNAQLPPND